MYAAYRYGEGRNLFIFMLNVNMPIQTVLMPSVISVECC
jgi:hypothetical protein